MSLEVPDNWNSMQTIRKAIGFPTAPEFTGQFLDWWKTLTRDQVKLVRSTKPEEITNLNFEFPTAQS